MLFEASLIRNVPTRRDQDLQRGQSLLSVDDLASLKLRDLGRDVIEHDGAEEVRCCVVRITEVGIDDLNHIGPEWFPVFRLVPDVGSLEERDEVADVLPE